jgi:hypothetical protein
MPTLATITAPISGSYGGTTQNVDFISTAPPAVAAHGQRWWNPEYCKMFMYYDEVVAGIPGGDGAQWVELK